MMDQMGVTQNQLEQQIRMYKQSKQGSTTPNGEQMQTINQQMALGNNEIAQDLQQQLK